MIYLLLLSFSNNIFTTIQLGNASFQFTSYFLVILFVILLCRSIFLQLDCCTIACTIFLFLHNIILADCCSFAVIPEGKVIKVTQGSIHAIVLGFSSAIITDEDIRGEFEYKIVSTSSPSCFNIYFFLLYQF